MKDSTICVFVAVAFCKVIFGQASNHVGHETAEEYINEWVVKIEGGSEVANSLANELGYQLLGKVKFFPDTYRMLKMDHPEVHKRDSQRLTQRLAKDARVLWAEQQFAKRRQKRGTIPRFDLVSPDSDAPLSRVKRWDLQAPRQAPNLFNDELWDQEWYLQDTRTREDLPKLDLHVLPVYQMGITGRGIRVTVLDDGLETTHEDLRPNYEPAISYDVNDDDEDPTPNYDMYNSNSHGTRCAGEIAMVANNKKCGVGVAFNARIGGVRMLDGSVSDRVEGTALGFGQDLIDIYSASWGPNDDGKTVEGPGRLALESLERGVTEGRNGKGVIFVWAAGNGGSKGDNCNCDGYTSSVYTLSIGSASEQGQFPWYGERCASTLAATYSSGAYTDQMIATTDLRNTCTIKHTGTSAAAPLAAGIVALTLEANPNLTWRDVQHLVVWTSEFAPLSMNDGWQTNAAGFRTNTRFGFGLMNAYGMVKAAVNWTSIPPKVVCSASAHPIANETLSASSPVTVSFTTGGCAGTREEVNFLEHVEVEANIEYTVRGALEIHLTSPAGTSVELLSCRPEDQSNNGFVNWKFMSVHTWGERPQGTWSLTVVDKNGSSGNFGSVGKFTLFLHGTKEQPFHMREGPRQYNEEYNRVHKKTDLVQPSYRALDSLTKKGLDTKGSSLDWDDLVGMRLALRSKTFRPSYEDVLLSSLDYSY